MVSQRKEENKRYIQGTRPTIGLLIDRIVISGGFQHAIWNGVLSASREQDVNLICFSGGSLEKSPLNEFEYQRNTIYSHISSLAVDGLIFCSSTLAHAVGMDKLAEFCQRFYPLPKIGMQLDLEGTPSVLVENKAGLEELITHLVKDHEYHRIAFVRGPADHDEAQLRYQTYQDTLVALNLPVDQDLIVQGNFTPESGRMSIPLLLDERRTSFEALIAANDNMAIGAMEELQQRGVQVPNEVAVVGFDNIDQSRTTTPALTTIRLPLYEMGQQTVKILVNGITHNQPLQSIKLPTQLIIRQSCGCQATKTGALPVPLQNESITLSEQLRNQIMQSILVKLQFSPVQTIEYKPKIEQILDAFLDDLQNPSQISKFITLLDHSLRSKMFREGEMSLCLQILAVFRQETSILLNNHGNASRIIALWIRVRKLLNQIEQIAQFQQNFTIERQNEMLRGFGIVLASNFNIKSIIDMLPEHLRIWGIHQCFVSLYEKSASRVRMVLAYDKHGRVKLNEDNQVYQAQELVPDTLLRNQERFELLVNSLYFRDKVLGFSIFSISEGEVPLYELAVTQISSALVNATVINDLVETDEKLTGINKELEQFAHIVSHDLQKPLTKVREYLKLLEQKYKGQLDENADDFINFAVDGAQRMQTMINDLLAYSKLKSESKPLIATDTNEVIKLVLQNLKIAISESNTRITHDDLPRVLGDQSQLMQLMQNLISNAIKFRPPNVSPKIHIGVTVHNEDNKDFQKGSLYCFSVSDNGIGIARENFERIFNIFQRLHTRDDYPGTGIGLGVVKRIVEHHGGKIWVDSEPGKGTTFYFTLKGNESRVLRVD